LPLGHSSSVFRQKLWRSGLAFRSANLVPS
jgi:hypothetical protein